MNKYQIMENELLYMHAALEMTVNKAQDIVEDRNMKEGERKQCVTTCSQYRSCVLILEENYAEMPRM